LLREPRCGPISISKLRASEIARRRTEEERAEALFSASADDSEELERRESNE
jgi:hypothetical protein